MLKITCYDFVARKTVVSLVDHPYVCVLYGDISDLIPQVLSPRVISKVAVSIVKFRWMGPWKVKKYPGKEVLMKVVLVPLTIVYLKPLKLLHICLRM